MEESTGTVVYRPLADWPGYRVGDDGSVWSRWLPRRRLLGGEWRRLKPWADSCGYLQVAVFRNGRRAQRMVHRLVLETFIGPCPPGMECLHQNDIKSDCRMVNLAWGTRETNMRQAVRRGRMKQAKLQWATVQELRRLYNDGMPFSELAATFCMSVRQTRDICKSRCWKEEGT